ncbi:hypothetical protein ACLOJK_000596 [Asimina triloba]
MKCDSEHGSPPFKARRKTPWLYAFSRLSSMLSAFSSSSSALCNLPSSSSTCGGHGSTEGDDAAERGEIGAGSRCLRFASRIHPSSHFQARRSCLLLMVVSSSVFFISCCFLKS